MNLKTYYQKIREIEHTLMEPFVVVTSHATPDGGKEGVLTEVPKQLAAKMIVDDRAHLASQEASKDFHERQAEAKRIADQDIGGVRTQVTLIPTELKKTNRTKE